MDTQHKDKHIISWKCAGKPASLQPVPTVATQLTKPTHQFLHDRSLRQRQRAMMLLCAGRKVGP